jgi:hypothetical protein
MFDRYVFWQMIWTCHLATCYMKIKSGQTIGIVSRSLKNVHLPLNEETWEIAANVAEPAGERVIQFVFVWSACFCLVVVTFTLCLFVLTTFVCAHPLK